MPKSKNLRPSLAARVIVRLASWIVPPRARAEWRARWDTRLWNWWILYERGELTTRDHLQVLRFCWGSLLDALSLRISAESVRQALNSALFLLAAGAAILLMIALLTRGFTATRALLQPPPVQDSGSLVLIRYTGAANEPTGVPPRVLPVWRDNSALLSDLAGFRHARRSNRAWVTANFFSLLGARAELGRTFQPGDAGVVVLSGAAWRRAFDGDPQVIGRKITLAGQRYEVIGVLPNSFWAISPAIEIWTPLVLEPSPGAKVPFLVGALGRVKPNVSRAELRQELFKIAMAANQVLPRPPEVLAFTGVPPRAWFAYLLGVVFALGVALVLLARKHQAVAGRGWRYWSFFSAKTLFAILIPALLWIETAPTLNTLPPGGGLPGNLARLVFGILFMFACGFGMWWSFADQRRRCPVCLQRLTLPVSLGSWSSVFDPPATELLCAAGHGSLCIPEGETGEPDRWTALDSSWHELFSGKP